MKSMKYLLAPVLALAVLAAPFTAVAADQKSKPKAKPYPLKTCIVSGEKLGEMGKPYVFEYKDREIKLCCKGCLKDFKKNPAKYLKEIEKAEARAKATKS